MDFPSKSVTVRPLRHQFLWIVFGSTEHELKCQGIYKNNNKSTLVYN